MTRGGRTGRYVMQPAGYWAFLPAPLPFDPPLSYDSSLLAALSEADLADVHSDEEIRIGQELCSGVEAGQLRRDEIRHRPSARP